MHSKEKGGLLINYDEKREHKIKHKIIMFWFSLFSAGAKLVHLVPLMFAGMTFTIFDAVANINNNINSNNNNNNIQNINFQQSVNTGMAGNIKII